MKRPATRFTSAASGKIGSFYSQHRAGRTFQLRRRSNISPGALECQLRARFAKSVLGEYRRVRPGAKLHLPWMPKNVYLSTDFLRGVYTNNNYNPRRPNYYDVRVSAWYAITK